jgi:sulfite exporter TauE/SafE
VSVVFAGFVLGLVSSAHCALMCGPLMLVFRRHAGEARHLVVYHGARLLTYAALGATAGSLGRVVSLGGFAGALSVIVGVLLIGTAVGRLGLGAIGGAGPAGAVVARLLAFSRSALSAHPVAGSFVAGSLNAFVPCGLLYASLAASALAPTPFHAAGAMAAYGLGTCPPLVAIWWSAAAIGRVDGRRWRLVTPVVFAIAGLLLVGRGLIGHQHSDVPTSAAAGPAPIHQEH